MVDIPHQDAPRLVLHDQSVAINLHRNQFGDRHPSSPISAPLHILNVDGELLQVGAF